MNKSKGKFTNPLMAALKFDEDDLAVNRAGNVSEGQYRRLRNQRDALLWPFAGLLVIGGVGGVIGFARVDPDSGLVIWIIFVIVAVGFVGTVLFLTWINLAKDLGGGYVAAIEGRVQLDVKGKGNIIRYTVGIDYQFFPVDKATFLAFKNGDPYRIYFAPNTKTILSAEWLYDSVFYEGEPS